MYKIIFLAMGNEDPIEQHNFNILDESFNTRDEAIKFVKEELVREDVVGFIDGEPDIEADHDFGMAEYEDGNDYTIEHSVRYKPYRELVYLNKYKIVEVKNKMKTEELFISGTKFVSLQDITFKAVDAISGEELQKCLLDGFKIKGNYIILPKGTIMIYDRKSKENDSIDFVNIGKNNYGLAYLEEKELLKINCLQN